MINGLTMSQIQTANLSLYKHYSKLNQIINQDFSKFSQIDRNIIRVLHHRKSNHIKWRNFQLNKFKQEISKDNSTFQSKLAQIKMGKSRYNFHQKQFLTTSKAHNFYIRKKRQYSIQSQNPEIAKRIINAQGSLNMTKSDMQFVKNRQIVHRLQRFPIIQRMSEISAKKLQFQERSTNTEETRQIRSIILGNKSEKNEKNTKISKKY